MIILTPLREFDVPIQAACITPENFPGKSIAEIAKMPVTEGNRNLTLGDLFKIEQSPAETPNITINGECSKVKRIGQGMKTGEIVSQRQHRHAHRRKNDWRQNHSKRQQQADGQAAK